MKKKVMSFAMIMVVVIFTVSVGYAEKKVENLASELSSDVKKLDEMEKKATMSKIDLLCYKYDLDPKILRDDLFAYFDADWLMTLKDSEKVKTTDEEITEWINEIIANEMIYTDKLQAISKKHNVPMSKISGIAYDYITWKELKQIIEYQEAVTEE